MKSLLFALAILSVSNSAFAFDEASQSSSNQAIMVDGHAAWYFSTATSLERQDWTVPQLILNSRQAIISPCNLKDNSGSSFDGFYPSFMSPGAPAGHTRNTGRVYFLNGCDTALPRAFVSRTFTIAGPSHRKAEDED